MRVFISVDMEGIAGVTHEGQTNPVEPRWAGEYGRFRRLMTAEANAAVEGALAAGATAVVVNDSHWSMSNLLAEELHPRAELVSGPCKPWSMLEGLTGECHAALFVGYHARAGTPLAVLDHTYTDRIHQVKLNGVPAGELAINAAFAGSLGVPIGLVTGDAATVLEAKALLGDAVSTVAVKQAVARHGARSLATSEACRRISEAAERGLQRLPPPLMIATPVSFEVEFASSHHADMAELVPGSRRDGRTVTVTLPEFPAAYRAFRALYNLASV